MINSPCIRTKVMTDVALLVLSTVSAHYGKALSAEQLAAKIIDPDSAANADPSAFSFLLEVDEGLQRACIDEMKLDVFAASRVAQEFSALAGYDLSLART